MRAYLYLLFSENGDVSGLGDFLESGDAPATQTAERLLRADRDARRVEVWSGDRLLGAAG